jgi:hypothetical protein
MTATTMASVSAKYRRVNRGVFRRLGSRTKYVHDLAVQIEGLSEGDLETLSRQVCGRALGELSRREASLLIGTLLEVLDGQIALDILLGRGDAEARPALSI